MKVEDTLAKFDVFDVFDVFDKGYVVMFHVKHMLGSKK